MEIRPTTALPAQQTKAEHPEMWKAAQALEAAFLAEMLKAAKLGESRETLGGGVGEDQFASFLVQEHASALVEAGGIGLSEAIFDSMVRQQQP